MKFGSTFYFVKSLFNNKAAIQEILNGREMLGWATRRKDVQEFWKIKEIANTTRLWDSVNIIIVVLEPIINLLRCTDREVPFVGFIKDEIQGVYQHLVQMAQNDECAGIEVVRDVWKGKMEREWDIPWFSAAAILNPIFGYCRRSPSIASDDINRAHLMTILAKLSKPGRVHMIQGEKVSEDTVISQQLELFLEGKA